MRRVSTRCGHGDERGAVVVLMVAFTIVLVGMAALVVDVGAIVEEKRQLQNGADAAALAVAHSCALGSCNNGLATTFADANSRDARSDAAVSYPAARRVTVTTTTSSGGTSILPYAFGRALTGVQGKTVQATATAGWSYLDKATALRLAISDCDVLAAQAAGFDIEVTLLFHSTLPGCDSSSGTDAGGAFGFLDDDRVGDNCEITVTHSQTATADPGNSGPGGCLPKYLDKDVLLVVYDSAIGIVGTGNNAKYTVRGFARFHITGYRFDRHASDIPPCSGSTSCIKGYFKRYVTPAQALQGGATGSDFGAATITLVS
jgi:Flp pilus assembly protein TadG